MRRLRLANLSFMYNGAPRAREFTPLGVVLQWRGLVWEVEDLRSGRDGRRAGRSDPSAQVSRSGGSAEESGAREGEKEREPGSLTGVLRERTAGRERLDQHPRRVVVSENQNAYC